MVFMVSIWWYGFLMLCHGGSMVVTMMLSCCNLPDYLQKQTKIDKGEGEGKHWRAVRSMLNGVFVGDRFWSGFKGLVLKNWERIKRGFGFGSLICRKGRIVGVLGLFWWLLLRLMFGVVSAASWELVPGSLFIVVWRDIIGGSDTTPPTDVEATKNWKIKAGNAMYAITITIEDEFLQQIKNAKTPKNAWDTMATIFTKKNDERLQWFENELLSISQWNILRMLHRDKNEENHCSWSKVGVQRHSTATRGWAREPTLSELENLLANEEDLEKPLSSLTIKDEDKTLFSKRYDYKKREAERSSLLGETKKINIKELNDKTSRRKASTTDKWRSATIVERKDITPDNVGTRKLKTSYAVEETNQQEELVTDHSNKKEEIALAIVSEKLVNYDHDWIVDSGCSNHMTGD
ncbi:hypothetical protein H5410_062057 [Solanum commersonii]|uniref:Uncharacterized protein n=1 Tax=Solanum commersonii TaxID=4109 RepID=A0A9J5W9C9_SOLCO|nr:hypothetical protein H5410_062057 [Solanum commersonii]